MSDFGLRLENHYAQLPEDFYTRMPAEKVGAAARERSFWTTPFADYEAAFLSSDWGRKSVAGLAGLAVIYGVCLTLGRLLLRQRSA